jgi:CheY-like chemotaxis protein
MAKILIVEDDPLMLRMYQKIFTLEKYEVEIATNGEEALEKVRTAEKPALILLDIMMPKMNGLEALDKLKANPDTQKIPVVMLTNLAGQQDAEEALQKGAVKYIIKSEYEPKQVVDMVKEVLAGYTRNEVPEAAPVNQTAPVQTPVETPAAPVAPVAPAGPAAPEVTPTVPPAETPPAAPQASPTDETPKQ